jgi:hypothetical protein
MRRCHVEVTDHLLGRAFGAAADAIADDQVVLIPIMRNAPKHFLTPSALPGAGNRHG